MKPTFKILFPAAVALMAFGTPSFAHDVRLGSVANIQMSTENNMVEMLESVKDSILNASPKSTFSMVAGCPKAIMVIAAAAAGLLDAETAGPMLINAAFEDRNDAVMQKLTGQPGLELMKGGVEVQVTTRGDFNPEQMVEMITMAQKALSN